MYSLNFPVDTSVDPKRWIGMLADAEALAQVPPIVGFKSGLRRGQYRSLRVINEVERQSRVLLAVTQRIESLQRGDAALEHAFAALPVHVVLEVTGQRSRDLDLLVREELRQSLLPGLIQDGEVAAVHHLHADLARAHHQAAKVGVELWRTPGQVELLHPRNLEESEHIGHCLP
jgi:hypothetical protein